MKKNVMLKIAAVVMVAVLLSTCFISTTLAKYSSTDKAEIDSARVAKWGVVVDVQSADLFFNKYASSVGSTEGTKDDVVAPGTKGSVTLDSFITGTPEVSGKIVYSLKITTANFEGMPLTFKVNDTDITVADYVNKVENDGYVALPDGLAVTFNPNTDLSTVDTLKIEWNWAFDGNDTLDTSFGDAAAKGDAVPTISVSVKVDVVQTADSVVSGN